MKNFSKYLARTGNIYCPKRQKVMSGLFVAWLVVLGLIGVGSLFISNEDASKIIDLFRTM